MISDQCLQMNNQIELARTQDFVIFGQPSTSDKSLYALNLSIYNLGNSQLDEFQLDLTPADGWQIKKQDLDKNYLLPQGGEPTSQIIYLNCDNQSLFEIQFQATYIFDLEKIIKKGSITKLPPPILYAELFRTWSIRTNFESIINQASKDTPVYQMLSSEFGTILKNQIDIKTLIDFLLQENQNGKEIKSHRDCILYFIVTAVTNSQCETNNSKATSKWISNLDNLASLFGFTNDHCYLFSLIYTLEVEKMQKLKLFTKKYELQVDSNEHPEENQEKQTVQRKEKILSQEIFSHIIRDKDLLLTGSQADEKKNDLIYYLMNLLVELNYYKHAYKFYYGFIDENVKNPKVQVNIIKTLAYEASLITAFKFLRKSDDNLNEKLQAMIEIVFQIDTIREKNGKYKSNGKISEFLHLPFNHAEKQIILQTCQVIKEVKFNEDGATEMTNPLFVRAKQEQNQEEEQNIEIEQSQEDYQEKIEQIQPFLEKYHIMIQIINQKNPSYKSINFPFEEEEKSIIDELLENCNYHYFRIIYLNI